MTDNVNIVSGQNVGKNIGQLNPITPAHLPLLGQFILPSSYESANYKLTVFEIVGLVSKETLGLSRVNNTSDEEKPLSTAAFQEFLKYWKRTELIPQSAIVDLEVSLANKRSRDEPIPIQDVQGLINALNNKLNSDGSIQIGQVTGLPGALDNKSSTVHNHQLVDLDGWTSFIGNLQQSLAIRPTQPVVEQMIASAVEESGGADTSRLILVNEEGSDWQ